nr:MAG TPA: hypothetical protein [Caudoviricetes sp.]
MLVTYLAYTLLTAIIKRLKMANTALYKHITI